MSLEFEALTSFSSFFLGGEGGGYCVSVPGPDKLRTEYVPHCTLGMFIQASPCFFF